MDRASNGKPIILPRTMNHATGKKSTRKTGFNDVTWGKATRLYAKSAFSLPNVTFNAILQDAQPFVNMKSKRARNRTTEVTKVINVDDEDEDERGCLVYILDNDEECKLF